ncbi:MAG: HigA family addiction module antitoxin [Pseudomonadota bacterium]|nr:HigA family addiction module antitoxin [Pseudomonadota bacterium]
MAETSERAPGLEATHPGLFLKDELLADYGLSQQAVADTLGVTRESLNRLLNGNAAVSPTMALRLEGLTSLSARFWLNMQTDHDLSRARAAAPDLSDRVRDRFKAGTKTVTPAPNTSQARAQAPI